MRQTWGRHRRGSTPVFFTGLGSRYINFLGTGGFSETYSLSAVTMSDSDGQNYFSIAVLAAVQEDGFELEFASEALRGSPAVWAAAGSAAFFLARLSA